MTTWAVVPVKRFEGSKCRLAGALTPEQRQRLSAAMLGEVLAALAAARGLDHIALATSEPTAGDFGCAVIDDGGAALNAAVVRAAAALRGQGARRMLVVAGDVPLATAADIERVLAAGHEAPVVVVPDAKGRGTNALMLSPPDAMAPQFGEDSRARHVAAARALGLAPVVLRLPRLGFDVDEPADLGRLESVVGYRDAYRFLAGRMGAVA